MEQNIRNNYIEEVKQIKEAIAVSRYRAARHVNAEILGLYYSVGKFISLNTRGAKWGTGALRSISNQLQQELPGLKGFSEGNMRKMRLFYEAWQPMFEPQNEVSIVPISNKIELFDFRSQAANELTNEFILAFLNVGFDNHNTINYYLSALIRMSNCPMRIRQLVSCFAEIKITPKWNSHCVI